MHNFLQSFFEYTQGNSYFLTFSKECIGNNQTYRKIKISVSVLKTYREITQTHREIRVRSGGLEFP